MRLISTEHGQSFQQYLAEEIRPISGAYLPDIVRGIAERYSFAQLPQNYETIMKEGAKYKDGRHISDGKTIAIKDLGFFSDGALTVAWNTDDSDVVLDDLISWATETFGFREPLTKPPRRFTSSVVVEFDAELDKAMTVFDELKEGFCLAANERYGLNLDIGASKIALSADPSKLPPLTTVELTIERRTGRPFSGNRYFSMATLPTASHLSLLEKFERRLLVL